MSTECSPVVPLAPARRPRRAAAAANPHVQFHPPLPPGQRRRRGQAQAAPINTPEVAVGQPTVTAHGIQPQLPTIPVRAPHPAQARALASRLPSNAMETSRSSSFMTASDDQPTLSLTLSSSPPSSRPPSSASSLSSPSSPSSRSSRSQSPRAGPHSKPKRVSKRNKDCSDRDTGVDVKKFFRADSNGKRHCLFCEYVVVYNCRSSVADLSHRQLQSVNASHKLKIYKGSTGSGNLRKHLYTKHPADWFSSCDELGIDIVSADKKLQSLLVSYREQRGQAPKPASDSTISRRKYTPEAFVDAIVQFIVADDQV